MSEGLKRFCEWIRALGDLLLPRTCLACGRRLGVHERHLCLACAADVPYTGFWRQAHNPLADRFNAVLERHRGTEPMDYAFAAALMYYKGPYRSIPRALKYHDNLSAGRFYGTLLGRHLATAPHFADVDLVIPVPLHWTRRHARGYNQAEVLARALAAALRCASADVCRTDILIRARRTRSQTRLSVEAKARNVASAFRVADRSRLLTRLEYSLSRFWSRFWCRSRLSRDCLSPESPRRVLASSRHILLVDDTFTTGATLYACYAALRPFTSARISVATLSAVEGTPSSIDAPAAAGP